MTNSDAIPKQTQVLIVGGGPVGLVASCLLSMRGIDNVVVEKRRDLQRAPAAHVLRSKPMEVLTEIGAREAIERAAPKLDVRYITWCATLGGSEVGRLDLREGGAPAVWTNCSQNRLEPILLENASARKQATIVRGVECTELTQRADAVFAKLRRDDGSLEETTASWVIAADGSGSNTRRHLGIEMLGQGAIGRFFMIHFKADLRPWIESRPGPLFWIMNPESSGTLIVHEPAESHVFMAFKRGIEGEERELPERLAKALAVPVAPEIISVDSWSPHVQVAERYREGRIFLAGDAAHRFPPTGGLGLNTGILEVHSLVGKLAQVESGDAGEELLDRYQLECRPAAETNANESFENMKHLADVSNAVGPCLTLEQLERRLATMDEAERRTLAAVIEAQRSHFVAEGRLPLS